MKYLSLLVICAGLFVACNSNDAASTSENSDSAKRAAQLNAANDTANFTQIQWLDSTHQELGKITEGGVVEITWRFKNAGNKPLIISNVNASCGCTVAEKPEEPVAAGAESVIKAKFDSKDRSGAQRKDVYVLANTSGTDTHHLSFALEVQKK